jgi:type IV secretory pathway VirB6-like protein
MADLTLTLACSKSTVQASSLGKLIGLMSNEITCASGSMANNLVPIGWELTIIFLFVMVFYHLLMTLLGEDWGNTLIELMRLSIKYAVVAYLLTFWSTDVFSFFTKQFDQLARTASGRDAGIENVLAMGWDAISEMFHIGEKFKIKECVPPGGEGDGPPCLSMGNITTGLSSVFKALGDLPSYLLRLVAAYYVAAMMAAYVIVLFTSILILGVGITIGPLLVPCLIFTPLENLFSNWLGFMITGGFYKIVAAIVIGIMIPMFAVLGLIASQIMESGLINIFAALLMIIIAMVGKEFMWAVPEYAASLGGVRLGRIAGFKKTRDMGENALNKAKGFGQQSDKNGVGKDAGTANKPQSGGAASKGADAAASSLRSAAKGV